MGLIRKILSPSSKDIIDTDVAKRVTCLKVNEELAQLGKPDVQR